MSLAKRLLEVRKRNAPRRRARHRIRQTRAENAGSGVHDVQIDVDVSFEPNKALDDLWNPSSDPQTLAAVTAAAEVYAEGLREALAPHNSAVTGTGERRSQRAKNYRDRYGPTIAEQVEVISESENTASVVYGSDVKHIGRFLEYGPIAKYWGRDPVEADSQREEYGFMRATYDRLREQANRAFTRAYMREIRNGG